MRFQKFELSKLISKPNSLAVQTIARALFGFEKRSTHTSEQMPRSKVEVLKEEPKTAPMNKCCEDVVGER